MSSTHYVLPKEVVWQVISVVLHQQDRSINQEA